MVSCGKRALFMAALARVAPCETRIARRSPVRNRAL